MAARTAAHNSSALSHYTRYVCALSNARCTTHFKSIRAPVEQSEHNPSQPVVRARLSQSLIPSKSAVKCQSALRTRENGPARRALHAAHQRLARRRNQRNRRQAARKLSPGPSTARATLTPRPAATIPASAPPSFQPRPCPSPRSGPACGPPPARQSRHPANRPGRLVSPRRDSVTARCPPHH